jgi:glucuronate isomerase
MVSSSDLERRLLEEILRIPLIDVHSHVPQHAPFAASLRDLLGYHYFTELAYSAGMDKSLLDPGTPDEVTLPALVEALCAFDNTIQYGWLIELAGELFGFRHRHLTRDNWQELAELVSKESKHPGRERDILRRSGIEKAFLTNSLDEDLQRIDRDIFVPSLRADNLVLKFDEAEVRQSLEKVTDVAIAGAGDVREALAKLVRHFKTHGAASVTISLPPHLQFCPVTDRDLDLVVTRTVRGNPLGAGEMGMLRCGLLSVLTELCGQFALPIQAMCGVTRGAYHHGVYQGQDILQAGDTLRNLLPLLNMFPEVTWCLSVLSDSQAQELASYGWMVRNVVVSGHWWYDAVPAYMERDLAARLQSVPKTKLIGFYSDAYKLEFALPKFNMYRRTLARVLARDLVEPGRWTEEEAVGVAQLLLHDNARRIFGV